MIHSSFGNKRIFSKSNNALLAPSFHGNGCRMIAPFGSRSFSTGRKVSDKKYVGYWSGDFAQCLKRHFSGHASKETKKNPPYGCVVVLQQKVPKSVAQTAKYIVKSCFVSIYGPDLVSGARISRSYSTSRELKRFAFEIPLCRSVNAAVCKWLLAKGTSKPSNKK